MKKVHLHAVTINNLGDDLFINILLNRYPNVKFYLITNQKNYKKLDKTNCKVYTNKIFYILKKIIFNFNLFNVKNNFYHISIGGSMFGEMGKLYWILNKYENDYKGYKKYFILGCNFGDDHSKKFYDLYHNVIFKKATDVCFRDHNSYNLFKDLRNCRCRPDVVFSLDTSKYKEKEEKKVLFSIIKPSYRSVLKEYDSIYEKKIIEIINFYKEKEYKIVLMSFCKLEQDESYINYLIDKYNLEDVEKIFYTHDVEEILNEFSSCEYVVATRFHAVILGLLFRKKFLPIVYDIKTSNVLDDLDFKGPKIDIKNMNNFKIEKDFKNIKKYDGNMKKIKNNAEEQFLITDKYFK